jgi:cellobiose-specific phosphotransferase system component IIC
MLVELLHTVRISIRSHMLVVEPFLIVGLIATIRRVLVLTLQAEALTSKGSWAADGKSLFQASMIELGVLGVVIAILVTAIYAMRRTRPDAANKELADVLPKNY